MFFRTFKKKIRESYYCLKRMSHDVFFFKGLKKSGLLIYDDIFPHPISGFRFEEFTELLKEFNNSKIILTGAAYPLVKTDICKHQNHIEEYENKYPDLKGKLLLKKGWLNINARLFYCVFINNIYDNLYWLEKYNIPFVFTLYPGGGFQVDDEKCNTKLRRVFSSPQFRKVIVTQLYTKDYLFKNKLCTSEKIEYIFGGVVPQISLQSRVETKKVFLKDKETFDIVFCAAKYMERGLDKGYDTFIETAISLGIKYDFVRFHVIGGFDKDEIDIGPIRNKIKFYGYQNFEHLSVLYRNMDVIISPNRPFFLNKGAFDGFPLGTVVEAVFNGVVAIVTDNLKQNTVFKDREELLITDGKVDSIEKEIIWLINNPEKLRLLSKKGRERFSYVYSREFQMNRRVDLLMKEINC